MNRMITAFTLLLAHSLVADETGDAMKHARRYGAETRIVLRCIDQDGNVVTNVAVSTALYPDGSFGNAIVRNGPVDTNGCFVMQGKTNGEFSFTVKNEVYYKTREVKYLFNIPAVTVSSARWQPYGMTNTVVLKRKVNPVAMCVKSDRKGILPPVKKEYIGFDLEKGDWVKPHGKGVHADLCLKYEYEAGAVPLLHYRGAVFFAFTNKYDGAYVMKKDAFSSFKSVYQADPNAVYRQEFAFVYDRLSGAIKKNSNFPESEYLIIRTRSQTDENGNLISSNYAKIYGPVTTSEGGIHIEFYFNPNENDPNLEADTTKNLLNPRDLGFAP